MAITSTTDESIQQFIGYFEEPEPGVPVGFTGWYHTGGSFALTSAGQVFAFQGQGEDIIRDQVAGPFCSRQDALADLTASLTS